MLKFTKGIDIKTVSIREIILGVLLVVFIGLIGLIGMNIMNRNMTSMYKNNLRGIASIGEVRKNFLQLRVLVNKATISYDDTYDNKIIEEYTKLEDNIRISKDIQQDDNIVGKIDNVEQYINEYMKTWEKSKLNLKGTGNLSEEQYNIFSELGNKIDNLLNEIREDNENLVDDANTSGVKLFMYNVRSTYIIIHVALMFLAAAGYIIISTLRKSKAETVNNMEMITYGYLTANANTEELSVFSRIKITLNRIIENINEFIRSIKKQFLKNNNNSIVQDNKTKNLDALVQEISLASQNVAAAIEVASNGTSSQRSDAVYVNTIFNQFSDQLEEFMKSMSKVAPNAENLGDMTGDSDKKVAVLVNSLQQVQSVFEHFAKGIEHLGTNSKFDTSTEVFAALEEICSSGEKVKTSNEDVELELSKTENNKIDNSNR